MAPLKESDISNLEHDSTASAKKVLPVDTSGTAHSSTNPVSVASEKASSSSTSGKVSVGNTSTSILSSNGSRKAAIIVNDSNETVYLNLSGTAVINEGIRLNAKGGVHREEMYTGAIFGICASGSKNVTVTEI